MVLKIINIKLIVIGLCLIFAISIKSQPKYDYQWILASNSLPTPGVESLIIDFNSGNGTIIDRENVNHQIGRNNSMICDENGELLVYANACEIFDSNDNVITNGSNLNPGDIHNDWCPFGDYPGARNSMMLPDPGNGERFYYLHKDRITINSDAQWNNQLFSYISTNEIGNFTVLRKNVKVDSLRQRPSTYTNAILHANQKDWWVIDYVQTNEGGLRLVYQIDQDSFHLSREEPYENLMTIAEECSSAGQACFSPDGTKYALYCPLVGIDIFDFDRETGKFSNYQHFPTERKERFSGLAFSPNGRFLYASSGDELHQLDLWEDYFINGYIKIADYDGFLDPFPTTFAWMQIGPDCKIYMTSTNGVSSFHVINNPDEKGEACNFVQHGFDLPFSNNPASLPNVPVYRLDSDEVCNPEITSVLNIPVEIIYDLDIYPNPTADLINVQFPEDLRDGHLTITSLNGQVLYQKAFDYSGSLQVSLGDFEAGMYLIEVVSEGKRYMDKVVVH